MYQIKLYGNETITLQGPGASEAVRGGTYAPGAGEGETLLDSIDVLLEGPAEAIEAALDAVERVLSAAERALGLPGALPVYLGCTVVPGGPAWRSPVLGGWVECGPAGADGRLVGAQAARIRVRRANFWEWEDRRVVYLENDNGSSGEDINEGTRLAVPVRMVNHADLTRGHANYVYERAADVLMPAPLAMPAPLRLELALADPSNTRPLTLVAGHWVNGGSAPVGLAAPVGLLIAGEEGMARGLAVETPVDDAGSQGGQYLRLDWQGSAEGELWAGAVPGSAASLMNLPFRLLARLAGGGLSAGDRIWYRWRAYLVDANGAEHLLGESAGMLMETRSECLLGPVMHLPPWAVADDTTSPGLRLALVAQAESAGAHALRLDFLQLLPLDGWRIYRPLDDQRTLKIIDDGMAGRVSNDYGWQSHAVEGPGLDLRPGNGSLFVFALLRHEPDGSLTWPVDLAMEVAMYYRGRRRMR